MSCSLAGGPDEPMRGSWAKRCPPGQGGQPAGIGNRSQGLARGVLHPAPRGSARGALCGHVAPKSGSAPRKVVVTIRGAAAPTGPWIPGSGAHVVSSANAGALGTLRLFCDAGKSQRNKRPERHARAGTTMGSPRRGTTGLRQRSRTTACVCVASPRPSRSSVRGHPCRTIRNRHRSRHVAHR